MQLVIALRFSFKHLVQLPLGIKLVILQLQLRDKCLEPSQLGTKQAV